MSISRHSAQDLPKDIRNWAMACHLMALTGLFTGIGFVLGPLITWLIMKEENPFIDEQGKEAVNFQLTMLLAIILCVPLIFIVIGIIIMPFLGIVTCVLPIIAAMNATEGHPYRYPFSIRFIK